MAKPRATKHAANSIDVPGPFETVLDKASMRVALSTGGGDAPGINAVIRAATLCALPPWLGGHRHP